jgi:hypothetical protein
VEVMNTRGWVHCGREFSAAEIADLCATVAWLPGLPRQELAATLCEHLAWFTLSGTPKIHACLEFLERLRVAGLLVLPHCGPRRRAVRRAPRQRWSRLPSTGALRPVGARPVAWNRSRRDRGGAVGCAGGALAPAGFPGGLRLPPALLHHGGRPAPGLRPAVGRCPGGGRARPLDRLDGAGPPRERGAGGEQQPLPDLSARPGTASGQPCARATRAPRTRGLARSLGLRAPGCWRPSSIRVTMPAPATVPPVGSCLGRPAGAGWPAPASRITARPARCGSNR